MYLIIEEVVEKLAPYSLIWNKAGDFLYASNSLYKFWHQEKGLSIRMDQLLIKHPFAGTLEPAWLSELTNVMVQIAHADAPRFVISGQIISLDEYYIAYGNPEFSSLAELKSLGLTISDLPQHEGTLDLLLAIQAAHALQVETQKHCEKLELISDELKVVATFPEENTSPVMRVNPQGLISYANTASNEILEQWGSLKNKIIPDKYRQLVKDVLKGDSQTIEISVEPYIYNAKFTHIPRQKYINIYFADATQEKIHLRSLEYASCHDSLTGVFNRIFFVFQLKKMILSTQREERFLSVLFLDMDNFKHINDSGGHAVGDGVLQCVARRLNSTLRQSDTIARLGGDEFAVLLPDTNRDQAVELARKAASRIREVIILDGRQIHISASIGVSSYPFDAKNIDDLLAHADKAMYFCKENHLLISEFNSDLEEKEVRARKIGNGLTRLVHSDSNDMTSIASIVNGVEEGELSICYQPLHYMNGDISGVESLLRWSSPELGGVSPAEFIPIAEELGLIGWISNWCVWQIALQAAAWERLEIRPRKISINISAKQFSNKNLTEEMVFIINAAGAKSIWFQIEVTETSMMKTHDIAKFTLQEMKAAKFSISIDDFGTGYSSLAYLKYFNADNLKIDIEFIRSIEESHKEQSIVRAIILMAHELDMTVTAEGVEKEVQCEILRNFDCDIIQGFLRSQPLFKDAASAYLRECTFPPCE